MKNLFIVLFIVLISSCDKLEIEYPYEGDGTQIEIYLIKDGLNEDFDPFQVVDINDMEDKPWLSHDNIIFYDWSSHSFYLNEEQTNTKKGNYFVLTADKKPVFTGFFHSSLMSSFPPVPLIITDFGFFTSGDVISLRYFGNEDGDTLRSETSNFRIAMEKSGLLKEGINVELLDIKRKNSSTLEYTYKVDNLDTEIIYILDPDKMGSSRFHYFTNGVGLRTDKEGYWAEDFEFTASDNIKSNWYYKLSPGKSITRTITLNGFISIPTGPVTASFHFPGTYNINKGEWKKPDGRIWIGDFVCKKKLTLR